MLQQTQVKTVVPFWERWMAALPTVESLARAKPGKIHKLWEGLGYYTRVRNMQRAAQVILEKHGGQLPSVFEQVLDLPGIGPYTAGAICSIAFNQPRPVLDGNVIRVLTRAFGIEGNPRDKPVNASLWALAKTLVQRASAIQLRSESPLPQPTPKERRRSEGPPGKRPSPSASDSREEFSRSRPQPACATAQIANGHPLCSHLNQSLMELGALVCTPRQPRCAFCPLNKYCVARRLNRVEALPNLTSRPPATRRRFVAFVVQRGARLLVRQRPAGIVNAHLWEFPNIEVANEDGEPRRAALKLLGSALPDLEPLCTIHHSITRYRIRLDVFRAAPKRFSKRLEPAGRWLNLSQLRLLAFASAHKKILCALESCSAGRGAGSCRTRPKAAAGLEKDTRN